MKTNVRRLALLGVFTTLALTIFMIESMLPPILPIPGVKLGLANIITLYLLHTATAKDALLVLIARVILASIFGGQMMSFLYSLTGGLLCFLVSAILVRIFDRKNAWITGMVGAIFHNVGQMAAAMLVLRSFGVFAYFPVLMISGILTGLFTGLCTHYFIKRTGNWFREYLS